MRIAKIEITGFKSFRDRVSVGFIGGINAADGPNGCRKSNNLDSARLAQGVQPARVCRWGYQH